MHDPLFPTNKVAEDATKARLGAKRAWITRWRNAQQRVTMKCLPPTLDGCDFQTWQGL